MWCAVVKPVAKSKKGIMFKLFLDAVGILLGLVALLVLACVVGAMLREMSL